MENFVNKIMDSKFMKLFEKVGDRLSTSPAISSLSAGMMGSLGIIMIGAVIQIILAIGTAFFGLDPSGAIYTRLYVVYQMTMGIIGVFITFNVAYTYARKLEMNGVQSGFVALICFIMLCSPITIATGSDGATTFNAINADSLGATGMFVGLVIALVSVRISKFVIDHNWTFRLPDIVPEGLINSFNAIIPACINIAIWYGISVVVDIVSGGAVTLPNLIIYVLSIPLNALISTPGMLVILLLAQLFWFFGIHGSSIIYAVVLAPMIAAYTVNAQNAAAGLPLVYSCVFLMSANGVWGGAGNTLPLVVMGLRSKSRTIREVSKASLVPGIFNINEPAIFGFPIMYNPYLFIPFLLCPVVCALLYALAFSFNLIALPQVLILSVLPVILQDFMATLSFRNIIFVLLLFPVCYIIYYPFFKMYEKHMVEQEQEQENGNAIEQENENNGDLKKA